MTMGIRYIACAWDHTNDEQRGSFHKLRINICTALNWTELISTSGLAVFCAPEPEEHQSVRLADVSGVVLGTVFMRHDRSPTTTKRVREFDTHRSRQILESGGQALVDEYWGGYVAFLHDEGNDRTFVLRDPSGSVPCFEVIYQNVRIYFSHIEDCCSLGLAFSVNWEYVAADLMTFDVTESRETGLREVNLLLAGERLELSAACARRAFVWDPRRIAADNPISDLDDAVASMSGAVRSCVSAWAADHNGILLQLSGGLDSSIVLSALADAPSRPHVLCLNQHSAGSNSDERAFARIAARKAGYALLEQARVSSYRMEPLLTTARTARPSNAALNFLLFNRMTNETASAEGCSAVFSGQWGDEAFFNSRFNLAVVDYIWLHGATPRMFEVAFDAAHISGTSIWHLLGQAIHRGLFRRPTSDDRSDLASDFSSMHNEFLRSELRERNDGRFMHPWLLSSGVQVPSGKLWHIRTLCCQQTFDSPDFGRMLPAWINPLRSQPLIETCLRIPTYLHVKGGWDRSIARRAFLHDLPSDIVARRSKGGRDEHAKEFFFNNLDFIRELLLFGHLANEGILDRRALEDALSGGPAEVRTAISLLEWTICAELWVHSWKSRAIARTFQESSVRTHTLAVAEETGCCGVTGYLDGGAQIGKHRNFP
jgi:asparagine synthase (glutamine-hydrolysing)